MKTGERKGFRIGQSMTERKEDREKYVENKIRE